MSTTKGFRLAIPRGATVPEPGDRIEIERRQSPLADMDLPTHFIVQGVEVDADGITWLLLDALPWEMN